MRPPRHQRSALPAPRSGFTLIELLTVIAIIGVLATLLASALASAKTKSQRTVCLGNLHQISVAVNLYTDDTGRRPRSMTRLTLKPSLLAGPRSLLCPADPVLLRPRGPKGETNQAWGNRANGSQELYSYDKNPEAGSFQAELAEKTETVPFSYLHPLGWAKQAWQKLASQGGQAGVSACHRDLTTSAGNTGIQNAVPAAPPATMSAPVPRSAVDARPWWDAMARLRDS